MSPFCSAHDDWLIMKLCMYVEYHDSNNVPTFGGDPVTQLNLHVKKLFKIVICYVVACTEHLPRCIDYAYNT